MTRKREVARLKQDAERSVEDSTPAEVPVLPPPPNIIDFVTGEQWLNRPNLYPRQATLLKIIFLQDHLFTKYDYQVINEWTGNFEKTGNRGIVPDVLRRIEINKAESRKWFREIDAVIGRRGGKGYLGALCGAYVLYQYMQGGEGFEGDPQGYYGIARDKRLSAMIFGGKLAQAKANQWRDLAQVILAAPCFTSMISTSLSESLTLFAPADKQRREELERRGVEVTMDMATFEIVPKESTAIGGRGPAGFIQFFDEMAHVVNSGSNRSAEEIYQAATPALDQFGVDGFIYAPSSPWQKTGQYYENCQLAQEIDDQTGDPRYPEMLLVQLTSWDLYKDWKLTRQPGGMKMRAPLTPEQDPHILIEETIDDVPRFVVLRNAVQEYDEQMRRLEMANPETFRVERRSQWATTSDAYLNEARVDDIFTPFNGETLTMQSRGQLSIAYFLHGDPSKSGANFGLSIAHVVADDNGWDHVVFDYITMWRPQDFPDNRYEIDYRFIEDELKGLMDAFIPQEASFDQFNSVHTIQELNAHARNRQYPKRVYVFERTANRAENWAVAETFKTAIGLGLVHAPYFRQAEQELKFLRDLGGRVDCPTSGDVKTKDVADTMMILTHALIADQMNRFVAGELAALSLHASRPGETAPMIGPSAHEQLSEAGAGVARSARTRNGERPRPTPIGGYLQPPCARYPQRSRMWGARRS